MGVWFDIWFVGFGVGFSLGVGRGSVSKVRVVEGITAAVLDAPFTRLGWETELKLDTRLRGGIIACNPVSNYLCKAKEGLLIWLAS